MPLQASGCIHDRAPGFSGLRVHLFVLRRPSLAWLSSRLTTRFLAWLSPFVSMLSPSPLAGAAL